MVIKQEGSMKISIQTYEKQILTVIILISVFTRAAAALMMGNSVQQLPGISDQLTYHTLANRLLDGFPFTFDRPWWPATQANEPTAHWSYLYTYFLSFLYLIFDRNVLMARLTQVILVGVFQPLFLYLFAKNFTNSLVALIAAFWISVYTYIVYYSAALMTESLFFCTLIAIFYFASQIKHEPDSIKHYIFLGIFSAATVLLRQVFLLFLPFLFLWMLWINRGKFFKRSFLSLGIAGIIIISAILPFSFYNLERFGKFSLLNTNAGFAFYLSNHPVYSTKFEGILSENTANYLQLLPKDVIELDEISLDQELLRRGIGFVFEDPQRYLLLSLSRIPVLFEFWPTSDSSFLSNITRLSSFSLALPFMLVGVFLVLKQLKMKLFIDSEYFLIILFGFVYSSIHILSWSLIRYRLPIDALFLIFSALTVNTLIKKHKFFNKGLI